MSDTNDVKSKSRRKRKAKAEQAEAPLIQEAAAPEAAALAESAPVAAEPQATPEEAPASAPEAESPKPKKRGRKAQAQPPAETAEAAPPPAEAESAASPEAPAETPATAENTEQAGTPPENNNGAEAAEEEAPAAPVNLEEVSRTIQALLFAAEEPIPVREIARAAGSDSNTVRKVLPAIKEQFEKERKPWDIAEVAGGWRMVTRPEFFPAIQRLKTQTAQRKLTQAALETLALIAYRQPIGRAEIESVRGVGAGPVLRLLLDKKLIKISGRGTGLGQPLLYGTTDHFLEHFGLKSIQELPKAGEFKGA